jgi:site-specific DNA-methyltransferase (adenine-specific)
MEKAIADRIRRLSYGNKHGSNNNITNSNNCKVDKNFNPNLRYPKNLIKFSRPVRKAIHPTQKPVALLEYLIKTYTLENEVVFDNCAGSFSTAIACLNTKRGFIGIEKEQNYFEIGCNRIFNKCNELDICTKNISIKK